MSGSSLDGLDIVLSTFDDEKFELLFKKHCNIPAVLAKDLADSPNLKIKDYLELESRYTDFIADEVNSISAKYTDMALISIHGHTVFHYPEKGFSCQMINAGRLASKTGINVLSDFRNQDIGMGGQGAPLAPIVESMFGNHKAYLNLGGIANISVHHSNKIIGYDICPCNQLFNHFAQKNGQPFDDKGLLGRKGALDQTLKQKWLALPYFNQSYPKSIDNQWLIKHFITTLEDDKMTDQCHTSYQFISKQISKSILDNLSKGDTVMCTGGGCYNDYLIELINEQVKHKNIQLFIPTDDLVDCKEAILMAYMGYLYLKDKPNTLPSVSGASQPTISGAYYKATT